MYKTYFKDYYPSRTCIAKAPAAEGKLSNYGNISEPTDVVNGIAGKSRVAGIANSPKFIGLILGAVIKDALGEQQTAPHVRAAENLPVRKDSGCPNSACEVLKELQKIYGN